MNQTAQGLAALGRGPDTQLVHMAPGEVRSLQQLAMAHGGSLTINPETGLPEAGFLSSILPMVLGAGAMMIPGLQGLGAAGIGLGIGGFEALRTGSLKKGLMAGLGAYGGAGLGSALAGAGMQAAANTQIAGDAAYKTAQEAMQQQATALGQNAAGMDPKIFADQARGLTAPLNAMRDAALTSQQTAFATASPFERLKTMGSGISNLGSEAGRDAFMGRAASDGVAATGIGGFKGLGMAGLAAAAPLLMETTTKQPEIKTDANMGQRYQFNAGTQTPTPTPDVPEYGNQGLNFGKEQRYFNPSYKQIDNDAARKLYGYASGGPVEDMSNANAIGMNTGYPQSGIRTGAYATPDQQPISRDMLPYAGQPQFAGGGSVNLQGTFDMGNGQGGGQMGGSNSPQPFVGSNNAPSMMPQQGFTPMPGPAGEREGMPGGLQGLMKNMTFAEGGAVDSYTYDPTTQLYVKKSGEGATTASPTGGASRVSGGDGGSNEIDSNPNWTNLSDVGKAGYFALNPFEGAIAKGAQNIFNSTLAGKAQNALVPGFQAQQAAIYSGMVPSDPGIVSYAAADPGALQGQAAIDAEAQAAINAGTPSPDDEGLARGGLAALAQGGMSHLGDYSDGGRLLRGPGDGISDSIPAMIGKKQPARLADGEFVVPARIVSELGNGSTEAGARKLYAMMERVQKARGKTVGKGKVAANSRSAKYLPA